MRRLRRNSFTLLELLVSSAAIAILALAAFLALRPAQMLKQSHDNSRITALNTLHKTIYFYLSEAPGSIGASSTVYISVPDPAATSSLGSDCQPLGLPALPQGWAYHCAGPAYYQRLDGSGWLPVDLTQLPSGRPFDKLAVDPVNATSSGAYYAYMTDGGTNYELTAALESQKYGLGGSEDKVSTDGGKYNDLYEVGESLALAPLDLASADGGGQGGSNYVFGGFDSPLQGDGSGVYNLGRTLPIKFGLTDQNGTATTSATARLVVTKVQNGIVGTVPVELATSTNDTGDLFRVSNAKYTYNLDTGQLGTGTWQLKAVLDDGSSYAVLISLNSD